MAIGLLGIIIAETTSLYVLTTSSSKVTVPILEFFIMIGADFFGVIHVVYRILSLPHLSSKKLIRNAKLVQKGDSPWFTRFLKSCSPLKIGMGDGNFFDRLTPFVIWQFCVDMLVNMLLIQRGDALTICPYSVTGINSCICGKMCNSVIANICQPIPKLVLIKCHHQFHLVE